MSQRSLEEENTALRKTLEDIYERIGDALEDIYERIGEALESDDESRFGQEREPRRSILLRIMKRLDSGTKPTASDLISVVSKTATYTALEDLELLGIIKVIRGKKATETPLLGRSPQRYRLNEKTQRWLGQGGFFPQKPKLGGIRERKDTEAPLENVGKTVDDGQHPSRPANEDR